MSPIHNDEPTLLDKLDRHALVKQVGETIATCSPPQVFGVHGDWGSGKTSFLHQLHLYLAGDCPQQTQKMVKDAKGREDKDPNALPLGKHNDKVSVVWFEAWRYQYEPAPVIALLHEIRSQLAWPLKLLKKLDKAAQIALHGALLSLDDLIRRIGIQASKVEQAAAKWEQDHLAVALPANTVREQLQSAISAILKHGLTPDETGRVVVMIDDLDRCEPTGAYRLLEGLKIYLTLPNCVFVIGMNQKIVEDAIAKYLSLPENDERLRAERATAYLEKLCQNVWRLPSVHEPKAFLLQLLPEKVYKKWVDTAIGRHRCLPPNPRRIKGLANLIARFSTRLPRQHGESDDQEMIREARLMLIVAYIYQFNHDLYRLWEHSLEVFEHILDWARGRPIELTKAETTSEKKEEEERLLFKILQRLQRVVYIRKDERTPTPEHSILEPAFPDPEDNNVFWIQPLVHEAALDQEDRVGRVDPKAFERYLHGV